MSTSIADLLEAHQRHANNHAPAGFYIVGCRCGWSEVYRERGSGYRRWAEHIEKAVLSTPNVPSPGSRGMGGDLR